LSYSSSFIFEKSRTKIVLNNPILILNLKIVTIGQKPSCCILQINLKTRNLRNRYRNYLKSRISCAQKNGGHLK